MEKKYVVLAERDLTPDENLWLDIRADAIKKTPEAVVASLTRLLTLATALAGGALVALKDEVVAPWARVGASAFFFLALAVAGYGLLPSTAALPPWPNHIRDQITRTLRQLCQFSPVWQFSGNFGRFWDLARRSRRTNTPPATPASASTPTRAPARAPSSSSCGLVKTGAFQRRLNVSGDFVAVVVPSRFRRFA